MNQYIVECLGTFFFISIILNSLKITSIGAVGIAVGLLAAIYFGGHISGGHFNPAVSIAMFLKNKLTFNLLIGYIVSQILGAGLAVKFNEVVLQS